jgi:hypothetical protein
MSKKRKVMNKNKGNEQPFDPELIEKIELMRPTPDRDPRLVAQGRERFLTELEGIPAASSRGWLAGLFKIGTPGTGGKNRKFAFPARLPTHPNPLYLGTRFIQSKPDLS